jgi:hypothetical protein
MTEPPEYPGRFSLSDILSPKTIATLVEASVLGCIRYQRGASLLLKLQIPAEMVRELLVSAEPDRLRLGTEIVRSAFTLAPEWIERAATLLATPLHQAMDVGSFFIGAQKRKELSTWPAARPARAAPLRASRPGHRDPCARASTRRPSRGGSPDR